ncbi:MAG: FAD-dependent oxidoreductase [Phycisphaerales bacterium JB040]
MTTDARTPVLIVGGGTGGVAAALALASRGVRCVLTEPTPWLGGQLTSQGVPPDENRWIESADFHGAPESYLTLRRRVRASVRSDPECRPRYRDDARLNPGGGWVSRLCAEPARFHHEITRMLAPHVASGLVDVRTGVVPVAATTAGDRVRSVSFSTPGDDADRSTVEADLVLDATELGDLYPLAGIEHAVGAESTRVYHELHARDDLPPGRDLDELDQQGFTWCFALEHHPGEDFTGSPPPGYDFWRSYVPNTDPDWPGPLFSWDVPTHNEEGVRTFPLVPWPDEPEKGVWELWRYRRLVDSSKWTDGRPDVTLMNVVQNDYWQRPLLNVTPDERAEALEEARLQSRCFLHWMRTEAPRHDSDGLGYPGLKLRGIELGSRDGLALAPYIREPRRLLARTMLTEAHVGTDQRRQAGRPNMDATEFGAGAVFHDSVAIGHYPIDLHPSCAGRNSVYVPACPFQVPMGALIPRRVRNVLAAAKPLGVSHVANGCTRLHPVEWAVGEGAGALAARCIARDTNPHAVHDDPEAVRAVREDLEAHGAPTAWPWDTHDPD